MQTRQLLQQPQEFGGGLSDASMMQLVPCFLCGPGKQDPPRRVLFTRLPLATMVLSFTQKIGPLLALPTT